MTKWNRDYSIDRSFIEIEQITQNQAPFTGKNRKRGKEEKGTVELTCSISILDSISYTIRDSTPPLSLPHMILVQTNTMKVALMPKPMTVVTKLVPEPNISNPKTNPHTHTHAPSDASTTNTPLKLEAGIATEAAPQHIEHRHFTDSSTQTHDGTPDKVHTWQVGTDKRR